MFSANLILGFRVFLKFTYSVFNLIFLILFLNIFCRVWECQAWQAERWNILSGRVQTASWSPCGNHLIFATSEEPTIFGLTFHSARTVFTSDSNISPNEACPLFDLTKVEINGTVVGGLVQNMIMDPKGKHLAVLFQDTNYVAVFNVAVHPVLTVMPW